MKKTMSIVLAAAMCLCMAVTAFAGQVEPRTPSCNYCGGETYRDYRYDRDGCGCNHDGCKAYFWIWKCSSCGEYEDISVKECTCSSCNC